MEQSRNKCDQTNDPMKTSYNSKNPNITHGLKLGATTLLSLAAWAAAASNIQWTGGTDSYTNTANWAGGAVPGINDIAINNNGSNNVVQANVGNPDWTVNQLQAGGNGSATGAFALNGPAVTLVGTNPATANFYTSVRLGLAAGSTGVLTVTNGTLNYGQGVVSVGELGTGILNVSGGTITGSGFMGVNYGSAPLPSAVTVTVGGGVGLGDFTWFEQGYYTPNGALGLPAAGSTIVSASQADHSFTFAPSYTANDAVFLSTNVPTATITPTTPTACYGLSFMGSAGNGPVAVNYTLHFADATTQTGTLTVLDWFPPANLGSSTNVLVVGARVDALGLNFQIPTGNPQLLSQDVVVTNTSSAVTSIDLAYVSGGKASLMAVSQQTVAAGAFAPMTFTGYNEDVVVEAGYKNIVASSVTSTLNQTGGSINITGGGQFFVGNYGQGVYNLSGGSFDVHNYMALGRSSGTGTLNMTGGTLNQDGGGNLLVGTGYQNVNGAPATGVLNQSGGTINCAGQLLVPENSPSLGTYNLSGPGTLNVSNWFVIGRQGGSGVMTISNNAVINKTSGGDFIVCDGDGSYSGQVTMASGTFNVNNWFRIGNGNGVQATFAQNGGTVNVGGQFLLPDHGDNTTVATYTMNGAAASLTVNSWLAVGRGGASGTLTITNGAITKAGGSDSHLDVGAGGVGIFNQEGGTVTNVTSDTWIGESSDGTYNLDGGIANFSMVHIAQGGSATGTLNINGGTLLAGEITTGSAVASSYLNLNGGVIQAAANNNNFIHDLLFVNLYAGGVTFDSQGYNIAIPQPLPSFGDGSGGITKTGSGTLTLSGANTYAGPTMVSAGTLATTTASTGGGDYSLDDNTTLELAVNNAGAQLLVANLALANSTAATLDLNLGAFGNPTAAPISVSSGLTVNGAITVNIADALPEYGQFPLIKYGSISGSGGFVLGNVPTGVGAYISNNVAAMSIDLVITNVNLPRWQGLAGGDWDIGLTTNWVNIGDGTPTFYAEGNKVLFDDNAQGTTMVNLTTTVNPNGVTVDNSLLPYSIGGSGKISGPAGLTKAGTGTLVVTNSGGNNYTGPTVVSAGVLGVTSLANGGAPSAIGAASSAPSNLVLAGGVLAYSGPAVSIDRGYAVAGTNQSGINIANNLTLTGATVADAGAGLTKSGSGLLTYAGAGSNVLAGVTSGGYDVAEGAVKFDGSNGGQTNYIGDILGLNGQSSGVSAWVTNSILNLGDLGLGNLGNSTNWMAIDGNSAVNVGGWLIFGDGGNANSTLTINQGTLNVNPGKILMGGRAGDVSTLNINGGVVNNAGGQAFDIADGNWNGAGARTGIVNQTGGTNYCNNGMYIGNSTGGTGFYNLTNGIVTVTGELDVGNGGAVGALNILNGVLTVNNWFTVGRAGSTGCALNLSGGTINKGSFGSFIIATGAGNNSITNSGTFNVTGGTVNSAGELWVAENNFSTGTINISGTAAINIHNWVTVGRQGLGVVNFTNGQFNADSQPFIVGIWGGSTGIWNQVGGALSVNQDIWIGQGDPNAHGTINLAGGVITNTTWLAVGRQGGHGVFNINGGTYVRSGAGGGAGGPNVSIASGGGATGTVNVNSGYLNVSAGDTWVGEDGAGVWNQNGGTAVLAYVQLARNASATGVLALNGGSLTATEITTGNIGATQRELDFNGGTLVAGADNTNFIHDLSAANVLTNGAVIDTASHAVSVNQALLGGLPDGGLTKNGGGTLYLNAVNTYTNLTQVNAGALGGAGTIAGSVNVAAGARLAPGAAAAPGTLTVNGGVTLAAGSSTAVRISLDGGAHNDAVTGVTAISYNGTLVVTNAGASPLTIGTQFQLFSAASQSGNFANAAAVAILPAGTGSFDPGTGKLTVTATGRVIFNPAVVSGGNLILTGNGGAAPGSGYTLLTSTNVAAPLSLWQTNTTGVLDGSGMFSNSIPINATDPARFFDVRVP